MNVSKEAIREYTRGLVEMLVQAYSLELHEHDGMGKDKLEQRASAVIERIHDYAERYDTECTPTALKSKCKDFGFVSKVGLNEKGAVTWG